MDDLAKTQAGAKRKWTRSINWSKHECQTSAILVFLSLRIFTESPTSFSDRPRVRSFERNCWAESKCQVKDHHRTSMNDEVPTNFLRCYQHWHNTRQTTQPPRNIQHPMSHSSTMKWIIEKPRNNNTLTASEQGNEPSHKQCIFSIQHTDPLRNEVHPKTTTIDTIPQKQAWLERVPKGTGSAYSHLTILTDPLDLDQFDRFNEEGNTTCYIVSDTEYYFRRQSNE